MILIFKHGPSVGRVPSSSSRSSSSYSSSGNSSNNSSTSSCSSSRNAAYWWPVSKNENPQFYALKSLCACLRLNDALEKFCALRKRLCLQWRAFSWWNLAVVRKLLPGSLLQWQAFRPHFFWRTSVLAVACVFLMDPRCGLNRNYFTSLLQNACACSGVRFA